MAKILLAEDDDLIREMLTWRLSRRGYEVIVASDGPGAMETAHQESPDLILLDLSLPGIDGWSVARQLKDSEITRATPIIALTAHVLSGEREKALAAGCDEFDIKPVDMPRLLEKIETLLARKGGS